MTLIVLSNKSGAQNIKKPYATDEQLGIAVDQDAFQTAEANALNLIIDARNLESLLIHFFNNAGTNSFDYQILGHAKEVDTPPTLEEPNQAWKELVVPTALANDIAASEVITDDWAWIAIRLRRTTSAQDSIADVFIRGKK